ncbi:hypothetical protein K4K49_002298 [Colletotrichum sp. SAR 10_70]|nr:hypothetical protein K4K50_003301 [Colletotrichum sp. SAR 10_71]KAI8176787.1 hypothetical protein K4K49_002298 [Colletotrichum sp. SAR 10_70]KAI8241690.1 hypothetical protein K4K53_003891 [Colletotrichum sp. SAR 10_77]
MSSSRATKKSSPIKTVAVSLLESFTSRDESPDPLSLPGITESHPSRKSSITDEPQAGHCDPSEPSDPYDHDDSASDMSVNYDRIYAISVSSDEVDPSWVPRTTHKRSPDPPKRPIRPISRRPFDPFIPTKTRKTASNRRRRNNKPTPPGILRTSSAIPSSTVPLAPVQQSASAPNILITHEWRPAGPVISRCVSVDFEKLDDGTRDSLRQVHLENMERVAKWIDVTEHERIKDLREKRAQEEFQGEKLLWFD